MRKIRHGAALGPASSPGPPLPGTEIVKALMRGRHKYRAVPTIYNGVRYASKSEARRAAELDAMLLTGFIRCWIKEPTFRLGCPENVYRPDFLVVPLDGEPWVEDVKGVETQKFKRDLKLWQAYGPLELRVIRYKPNGVHTYRGGKCK